MTDQWPAQAKPHHARVQISTAALVIKLELANQEPRLVHISRYDILAKPEGRTHDGEQRTYARPNLILRRHPEQTAGGLLPVRRQVDLCRLPRIRRQDRPAWPDYRYFCAELVCAEGVARVGV
jgi:hypothetical protein